MVQRLNFLINNSSILLIRFYQKFISKRIDRACIYPTSCSNYALEVLRESNNIFKSIYIIYNRYKSCKICNIVCEDAYNWHIINANGQIIRMHQLNDNTIKDITQTIDSYKLLNSLE